VCPTNKLFENEINRVLKFEDDTKDSDMQQNNHENNSPNLSVD
jgi:hypothetical protein